MSAVFPVYPKQQTFPGPVGTSHLCQERKYVAGGLDDAAGMLGDGAIDDIAAVRVQAARVPIWSAPIRRE
jgi:hypothetical protein